LVADKRRFVTHHGVLLEIGNALSSTHLRLLTIKWKAKLDDSKTVKIVELNDYLYQAGWRLYANRQDKDWGIVGCISFMLMEKEQIREALTADRHFEQAGFVKLL
jgi:predicted nucleic acid-binding protein